MKAKTRRKIVRAKASLESRLAAAVVINEGGPLMGGKPGYELSEKARANPWGGIGALHRFALKLKLPDRINNALHLLKLHVPYHESDHVLNIAYNLLCSGRTLDDIEHRRQCQAYLDTLGPEEALFSGDVIGGAYGGDARHEAAFSPRGSPEPNDPRLGRAAFARAQRVDARRRTRQSSAPSMSASPHDESDALERPTEQPPEPVTVATPLQTYDVLATSAGSRVPSPSASTPI